MAIKSERVQRAGLSASIGVAFLLFFHATTAWAGWPINCGGKQYWCETTGCTCQSFASSTASSSSGSGASGNAAAKQQLLQGALQLATQMAEDSDRRAEMERQKREREAAAEAQRQAVQQGNAAQMQQQMDERIRQLAGQDRARDGSSRDNPWGEGANRANAAVLEQPDPNADFSGKACRYFTCNAVRADGAALNYHAKNSFVIYGKTAYKCIDGYWQKQGPASAWLPAGEANRAENLERGCQN